MRECIIYGLIDPRTGQLRYVGQSSIGMARARHHSQDSYISRDKNVHKRNWLKLLKSSGKEPEILVIDDSVQESGLNEAERHYIAYFRFIGCRLLNFGPGGEGGNRLGQKLSESAKELIRMAKIGKKHSDETRRKMAEAHKLRKPISDETRARMAASKLGNKASRKPRSPEAKARMAAAQQKRRALEATGRALLPTP